MVKQAVQILTVVMAFVAIGGFALIYSQQIYSAWSHNRSTLTANDQEKGPPSGADQKIDNPYSYVATSLASLVGAVIAVLFGRPAVATVSKKVDWAAIVSIIYAYVYVLLGIAALVTWMKYPNAPVLVKTLALAFFGLLIPVVTSFLKPGALADLLRGTNEP